MNPDDQLRDALRSAADYDVSTPAARARVFAEPRAPRRWVAPAAAALGVAVLVGVPVVLRSGAGADQTLGFASQPQLTPSPRPSTSEPDCKRFDAHGVAQACQTDPRKVATPVPYKSVEPLTLHTGDDGGTFHVVVGQPVQVKLEGEYAAPRTDDSGVLVMKESTHLQGHAVYGYFGAVHAGEAYVTTDRCFARSCLDGAGWTVRIVVDEG